MFRSLFQPARHSFARRHRAHLELVPLDDRTLPSVTGFAALGATAGGPPLVTVERPNGSVLARFLAYDQRFTGGVHAAVAELDGNPNTVEVVTGAGPGGGPHVRVFRVNESTGAVTPLAQFYAFSPNFHGGVNVAAGNLGMNNTPVIVAGTASGAANVRVFNFRNGQVTPFAGPLGSFTAFSPGFTGGVGVAVGNFNGAAAGGELAVGAGPGGGSQVTVFRGNGTVAQNFPAFGPGFTGGINLGTTQSAAAVGNSAALTNVVVAQGAGASPQVNVFGPGGAPLSSFTAFGNTFANGVNLSTTANGQLVARTAGGAVSLLPGGATLANAGAVTGFGLNAGAGATNLTVPVGLGTMPGAAGNLFTGVGNLAGFGNVLGNSGVMTPALPVAPTVPAADFLGGSAATVVGTNEAIGLGAVSGTGVAQSYTPGQTTGVANTPVFVNGGSGFDGLGTVGAF